MVHFSPVYTVEIINYVAIHPVNISIRRQALKSKPDRDRFVKHPLEVSTPKTLEMATGEFEDENEY